MREERCQNPHPDFPGQKCDAKNSASSSLGGVVTVPCRRCGGVVSFDFESVGTEAVDKQPVMV